MKRKVNANQFIAEAFKNRMKDLGISQYKFVHSRKTDANRPTLVRLLRGEGSTQFDTVASYADWLGLEIVFQPKESCEDTLKKLGLTSDKEIIPQITKIEVK